MCHLTEERGPRDGMRMREMHHRGRRCGRGRERVFGNCHCVAQLAHNTRGYVDGDPGDVLLK